MPLNRLSPSFPRSSSRTLPPNFVPGYFSLTTKGKIIAAVFPSQRSRDFFGGLQGDGQAFGGKHGPALPFREQKGEIKGSCPAAGRTSQLPNLAAGRGHAEHPLRAARRHRAGPHSDPPYPFCIIAARLILFMHFCKELWDATPSPGKQHGN